MKYEDFVCIGKVAGCTGLKGNLKINPLTDYPERFLKLKRVYLFDERKSLFALNSNDEFEFKVEKCEVMPAQINMKFKNIDSREQAEGIIHYEILVPEAERVKLPKGKFYHYEIIGFDVYDVSENEKLIGKLAKIENFGSDDLMNVTSPQGKEILIPYRDEFVKKIDAETKRIDVELIEGFLE